MLGQLGGVKRSYAERSMSRGGVWVSVCLPVGVLGLVEEYAHSSGLGRNQALQSFLRLGLGAYLRGKTTLLKAIAQAEKPAAA